MRNARFVDLKNRTRERRAHRDKKQERVEEVGEREGERVSE